MQILIITFSHAYGDTIMFSIYLQKMINELPNTEIFIVVQEPLEKLYLKQFTKENVHIVTDDTLSLHRTKI